jgi:hypothetical protein
MAHRIKDQLEVLNQSTALATPQTGMAAIGVVSGRVVAKGNSGEDIPVGSGHAIADSSGTQLPARGVLKISGPNVVLADDSSAGTTLLTINPDTDIPGHVIGDGEGTQYTQRAKLIFEGPGLSEIIDDATNDATIVNIQGGGGGSGDITPYVSNCVLAAPPGYLTYSGNVITAASGLSVLIPNGLNEDGTFSDVQTTLAEDATVTQSLGPSAFGIVFAMANGSLQVLLSNQYVESSQIPTYLANTVWYNSFENLARQYDSSGTLTGTFSGAPIGTFSTDENGDINSIEAYGVTRINNYIHIRYWDL